MTLISGGTLALKRAWYRGCALVFQAREVSSSLTARSNPEEVQVRTILVLMLTTTACHAASFTVSKGVVTLNGNIEQNEYARFMAVITASHQKITLISLHSYGGKIDDAMRIGREIRSEGWSTTVVETCQSACALIWAAGSKRFLPHNASIGFHQPNTGDDTKTVSIDGVALIGAYLNNLGYSGSTVLFAVSASPINMRWILTEADARVAGITINPSNTEAQYSTPTRVTTVPVPIAHPQAEPSKAWPQCGEEKSNESYSISRCWFPSVSDVRGR